MHVTVKSLASYVLTSSPTGDKPVAISANAKASDSTPQQRGFIQLVRKRSIFLRGAQVRYHHLQQLLRLEWLTEMIHSPHQATLEPINHAITSRQHHNRCLPHVWPCF